jgi:hypothetical protein
VPCIIYVATDAIGGGRMKYAIELFFFAGQYAIELQSAYCYSDIIIIFDRSTPV